MDDSLTESERRDIGLMIRGANACLVGWEGSDPEVALCEVSPVEISFRVMLNVETRDISYAAGAARILGAEVVKLLNENRREGWSWKPDTFTYHDGKGNVCDLESDMCVEVRHTIKFVKS